MYQDELIGINAIENRSVVANGTLYAAREDGTVFSARVEEKFELLGENPMGERVIASPGPAANRLLIRGDKHLFCVGQ